MKDIYFSKEHSDALSVARRPLWFTVIYVINQPSTSHSRGREIHWNENTKLIIIEMETNTTTTVTLSFTNYFGVKQTNKQMKIDLSWARNERIFHIIYSLDRYFVIMEIEIS